MWTMWSLCYIIVVKDKGVLISSLAYAHTFQNTVNSTIKGKMLKREVHAPDQTFAYPFISLAVSSNQH